MQLAVNLLAYVLMLVQHKNLIDWYDYCIKVPEFRLLDQYNCVGGNMNSNGSKGVFCTLLTIGLAMVGSANATLITDEVFISYNFPDINTINSGPVATIVTADSSDAVNFFGTITVDVGGNNIFIDQDAIFIQPGDFNGVVVSDMDWVDMPGEIVGLSITTNLAAWDDSRATFTADSVAVNLAGLGDVPAFTLNVGLETTHVPEPATLALLSVGLAGLGFTRRGLRHKRNCTQH